RTQVREFLPGRAGERRFPRLCWHSLPISLPRRDQARRADRAACFYPLPPALPEVSEWRASGPIGRAPVARGRTRTRPASGRPPQSAILRRLATTWASRCGPRCRPFLAFPARLRERALGVMSEASGTTDRLEPDFHSALLRLAQSVACGGKDQSALVLDDDRCGLHALLEQLPPHSLHVPGLTAQPNGMT